MGWFDFIGRPRPDTELDVRASAQLAEVVAERDALRAQLEAQRRAPAQDPRFVQGFLAFGATVAESQRSLALLAQTLREEKGRVIEAGRVSGRNGEVMARINGDLARLGVGSREAAAGVDGLSDTARRIADVLTLIRDVAEQTHMLALNAAIEAARAGEAGRGFAIVAGEVRALAGRTGEATAEIEKLVTTIEKGTASAHLSMDRLEADASRLAGDGATAARDLDDMRAHSTEMGTALGRSALRAFVELAKVDHLVYKFEVYRVLTGDSTRAAEDFASHRKCRLGSWYYEGEGRHCFSRLDGYAAMEDPHLRVHEAGKQAVLALGAGSTPAALDQVLRMEEASRAVLACLERMAVAGDRHPEMLCSV